MLNLSKRKGVAKQIATRETYEESVVYNYPTGVPGTATSQSAVVITRRGDGGPGLLMIFKAADEPGTDTKF